MIAVFILFLLANLALLVPASVFAIEVLAGATRRGHAPAALPGRRPGVAVLVPAHQEEAGIGETVTALRAQLGPADRLLVVADNCSDETAALARSAGAEVVERRDPDRRGKGYALDFGVRHLEASPPEIVLIVDADCTLAAGAIDRLAVEAVASRRPVQGCYLMAVPPGGGIGMQVAEFAFLVKNRVRPAGLHRLGLPCHLTGTGMAFPWAVLRDADLAHGSLVEDMKLGLDLAMKGTAPRYCESARIHSYFPYSQTGAATQRRRWEEGHLGLLALAFSRLPGALAARQPGSVALTLDILVPPLTLLLLFVGAAWLVTGAATLMLGLPALVWGIASANLVLLLLSLALAWHVFGRAVLPARSLVLVVPYILQKLRLYGGMALGSRSRGWVRTDRQGPKE
jgi:cellulose synthase/poly-beta-1,6-N-acetylglucosamine synthase-like glycosyltransferase